MFFLWFHVFLSVPFMSSPTCHVFIPAPLNFENHSHNLLIIIVIKSHFTIRTPAQTFVQPYTQFSAKTVAADDIRTSSTY